MKILRFTDVAASGFVRGKRVFIRADLNVPLERPQASPPPEGAPSGLGRPGAEGVDKGTITEDTRIRASIPCIEMALKAGAAVMVTSHLGRPTEGEFKPEDSLAPVAVRLGLGW